VPAPQNTLPRILSCYQKIGFKKLEEHITTCHDADLGAEEWRYTDLEDASTGKCAPICSSIGSFYEMMSRRQDSVRFFATLAINTENNAICIWVTAACSKEEAEHYRAEIRLDSLTRDSGVNFSCSVLSLESDILEETLDEACNLSACLFLNRKFYLRYEENYNTPVTCTVHRKVFCFPSTGDFEEK
jgi:hypothetical protein